MIFPGKCLSKSKETAKTKFKIKEREDEIIACYEAAGDLALLCLQVCHNCLHPHVLIFIGETFLLKIH